MRKVFSSVDMPRTILIRDALLHEGIPATIQNQNTGFAAILSFRAPAEVWVENDGDLDKAKQTVRETISQLDSAADDEWWKCIKCNEQNPQSFDSCWNCDSARHSVARQ
jgi:hypothetical protein